MYVPHGSTSHFTLPQAQGPQPTPILGTGGEPSARASLNTGGRNVKQPHSQLVQHPLHFLIDTHGRGLVLLFLVRLSGGIALRQRGVFVTDLLALPLPPHRGWDLNGRQVQRLQKRGRVRGREQVVGRRWRGKEWWRDRKAGKERDKERKEGRKEEKRERERDGLIMIRLKMVQWIKHGFSIF